MTPIERITERVSRLGDPDHEETPRPLLSIEEFFDGNDYVGSIGCNLPGCPHPRVLHALFNAIAIKPEVKDIRIQITQFDDPEWPFSDTVFIVTTSTPEIVRTWFPDDLAPDEVFEDAISEERHEPYAMPAGCHAVACWWD
jgi:hypothetical protein